MAINPITFANRVNRQFLRYQMTAFPLSDESIANQANQQITGREGDSPLIKGPYVSLSRAYKIGPSIEELVNQGYLHPALQGIAKYHNVFQHQYETLKAVHDGNHVIVSTGTGSGKTEAFLYPILNDCLKMRDAGEPDGIVAIVVYPMNALAIDQLDRLRELLAGTGITFGMYVGNTPADENKLTHQVRPDSDTRESYLAKKVEIQQKKSIEVVCPFEERWTEKEMAASHPRIMLTNFNQLEILLTRGRDIGMFINAPLKYLVFDEAHTYSGVKGAEVSLLIRRLRSFVGKSAEEVTCIGSSATIYDPEDPDAGRKFACRFFGIDREKITLVEETFQEQEWGSSLYSQVPFSGEGESYLDGLLTALENNDPIQIAQVASGLTGFEFKLSENWQEELYDHFQTSKYVKLLFERLQTPTHIEEAIEIIAEAMGRENYDPEAGKVELLATLALCGTAIKDDDPLLKPKLHFFVHGLHGAIGVLLGDEQNNTQVNFFMSLDKAIESHPDRLPDAFYPVSTCRVCGQHVLQTHLNGFYVENRESLGGDAEGKNVFWLAGHKGEGEPVKFTNRFIIEDEDLDEEAEQRLINRRIDMFVCPFCGTFHKFSDDHCSNAKCARNIKLLLVYVIIPQKEGSHLVGCPSCKTRVFRIAGQEREPFRNFRAITVADIHILSQDMLNAGRGDKERLIVFADNRQDAAFQAGWMQDHARRFRLRNLIYTYLKEQTAPVSLTDIENYLVGLYDTNRPLIQALCPEVFQTRTPEFFGQSLQDTLAKYLRIQLLMEFNTSFNHARSLETWGLLEVVYGHVQEDDPKIKEWTDQFGMSREDVTRGIKTILDMWRRNARLLFDDREPIYSHYWHPSDKEIANGFLPYMDFPPKGLKLVRGGNDRKSLVTQVLSKRGITLAMGFTRKWGLSAEQSNQFLEELWEWLIQKGILQQVQLTSNKGTPLSGCSGTYQIVTNVLGYKAKMDRYQCNICHRYHTSITPKNVCTTHHCKGKLQKVEISKEDYNISTLLQPFTMVMAQEHSAQVPHLTRERIEREFKNKDGHVNTLVATPTLEMGVDIGDLDIILLRNVPPSSSNYWQRVGRAGRRHRMAVLYTYCRNSAHDNYFFDDPYRLLRSPVSPPRFNLQNAVMIRKHVHAAILSYMIRANGWVPEEFPTFIDGYLFDEQRNYRNKSMDVSEYGNKIRTNKDEILSYVVKIFRQYWPEEAEEEVKEAILEEYIDDAHIELQDVVDRLFTRMSWTRKTIADLIEIMNRRNLDRAEERLMNRCRDYLKSLAGHTSSSYTLTVLASNGYLPGYGTYAGSIVGYAERFRTTTGQSVVDFELARPPSIAIREFVPGNLIYANSGKFQVGLYHLPIDQDHTQIEYYDIYSETEVIRQEAQEEGYADPETLKLLAIPISDVDLNYVSRISDEEPARFQMPVKIMGLRRETHRGGKAYTFGSVTNCHHIKGQDIRLINVGPTDKINKREYGYWVCSICGGVRSPYAYEVVIERFKEFHKEKCGREPEPLGFTADVTVDGLLFKDLKGMVSAVNLGETLKRAAASVIEMDEEDLQTLFFPKDEEKVDLFLYDPMPGGSGLLQQILDAWVDVRQAGLSITKKCPRECETACYECLRSYRNIFHHGLLNRHEAARIFEGLEKFHFSHDIPENIVERKSEGEDTVESEAILSDLLEKAGFPLPIKQKEIPISIEGFPDIKRTTPDCMYEEEKVAIYVDSKVAHGDKKAQLKDRLITDRLEEMEWTVLRIYFSELKDPVVVEIFLRKLSRELGKKK